MEAMKQNDDGSPILAAIRNVLLPRLLLGENQIKMLRRYKEAV